MFCFILCHHHKYKLIIASILSIQLCVADCVLSKNINMLHILGTTISVFIYYQLGYLLGVHINHGK